MSQPYRSLIAWPLLVVGLSCSTDQPTGPVMPKGGTGAGVTPMDPDALKAMSPTAGQSIYVPAYSHVYSSNEPRPFPLAATLSVRNIDPDRSIIVTRVRYFGSDGQLVRNHLKGPIRLAPLASVAFFVAENDAAGGFGANFVVEWVAPEAVVAPIAEAVMIGTARTQGISFVCAGRVIRDRAISP